MKVTISGKTMTIVTELSSGTPSKTGKTLIVATTSGFQPVEGHPDIRISLNVIKSK